ncbi:hypothetical protein BpHYR1_025132 [Brachionus plicatilis]|uniref:Uncharacterized protein n=1 Tax=Brachionus plicatilis TaxID=10195 RepID=A0A3M7RS28_BRAPC|nr:hypothetical protein BpHYR1_025132 [Brachionus plicatilis]
MRKDYLTNQYFFHSPFCTFYKSTVASFQSNVISYDVSMIKNVKFDFDKFNVLNRCIKRLSAFKTKQIQIGFSFKNIDIEKKRKPKANDYFIKNTTFSVKQLKKMTQSLRFPKLHIIGIQLKYLEANFLFNIRISLKNEKNTLFSPYSKLIQFRRIENIGSIDLNGTCLKGEKNIAAYSLIDQKYLKSENLISNLFFLIRINGLLVENRHTNQTSNRLIESCEQLKNVTVQHLLNSANIYNVRIQIVLVNRLMETFYAWQIIKFENYTGNSIMDLNSNIEILDLTNNLKELRVFGEINSIQEDLFNNFKNLRSLYFDGQNARKFFHKVGINWIKFINKNIDINFSKLEEVNANFQSIVVILFAFKVRDYVTSYYEDFEPLFDLNQTFPEEDFCLYKDIPFNQLIHFYFDLFDYDSVEYPSVTCTFIWLKYLIANLKNE